MKQIKKSDLKKQALISMAALVIGVSIFSPSSAYDEYQFLTPVVTRLDLTSF